MRYFAAAPLCDSVFGRVFYQDLFETGENDGFCIREDSFQAKAAKQAAAWQRLPTQKTPPLDKENVICGWSNKDWPDGASVFPYSSLLLLMILLSSSIKLLISLNWRYTEAKRT